MANYGPHCGCSSCLEQFGEGDSDVEKERDALKAMITEWLAANCPDGWIGQLRAERDALKVKVEVLEDVRVSMEAEVRRYADLNARYIAERDALKADIEALKADHDALRLLRQLQAVSLERDALKAELVAREEARAVRSREMK